MYPLMADYITTFKQSTPGWAANAAVYLSEGRAAESVEVFAQPIMRCATLRFNGRQGAGPRQGGRVAGLKAALAPSTKATIARTITK